MLRQLIVTFLTAAWLIIGSLPAQAGGLEQIRSLAGSGAVVAAEASGRILVSYHPDRPLIPASILKIVTAAAALEVLGPEFRFITDFALTPGNDLVISGRGDPLLTSEEIAHIAGRLKAGGLNRVGDIVLEAGFFAPGLVLDGNNRSLNPYDAYNGALNANFNTIFVRIDPAGKVASAEDQTPLTPLAEQVARQSGRSGRVRLNLAQGPEACLLYAGQLFEAFFLQAGIQVSGRVRPAGGQVDGQRLIYRHYSRFRLNQVAAMMLEHSSNFMANQVFLAMGAQKIGPPATPAKARTVMADYLSGLGLAGTHIEEGSGLSRRTRISGGQMIKVLEDFRPYRRLLTRQDRAWLKTGTLAGVRSLAGYLALDEGPPLAFVIILNGTEARPGRREKILEILTQELTR